MSAMAGTDARLITLETRVTELTSDLRVLRTLIDQDHASALNKIRYVTEKVLHRLCQEHAVSWGSSEPTVENMIGPLVAKKVIPRNVAIHVRTIQTNASPGSHFQETPLSATHVQVAQIALLDFLEWFYKVDSLVEPKPLPAAVVTKPRRVPRSILVAVGLAAGAAVTVLVLSRGRGSATTSAAALTQPHAGQKALAIYRSPRGSEITTLDSVAYWENAERDFRDAARQTGAPAEWTASAEFAAGQALARSGKLKEAIERYHAATTAAPQFPLPYAGLAIVLAESGDPTGAIQAAQQAQRIDPTWWGGVAAEARVYVRSAKLDNAIQTYRRALQIAPKDPVLLSELALVYHVQHLDSEAERYARDAIAADPDIVAAHLLLAERALEDGDAAVAVTEATRAVAGAPDHLSPRLALADAQILASKPDDARANYQRALAIWKALDSRLRGEHDARMKLVDEALARNELPITRTQQHEGPTAAEIEEAERSRSSAKTEADRAAAIEALKRAKKRKQQQRTDERTAPCNPGDPLCGIQ